MLRRKKQLVKCPLKSVMYPHQRGLHIITLSITPPHMVAAPVILVTMVTVAMVTATTLNLIQVYYGRILNALF